MSDAQSIEATTPPAPVRPPRPAPKSNWRKPNKVTPCVVDGAAAVRVPLHGRHGYGRQMILDPDGWAFAKALSPSWCLCIGCGRPPGYVISGAKRAAALVSQPGTKTPVAALARLLTEAAPGEYVVYDNNDPLDLRRINLLRLTRAEFYELWRQRRLSKPKANT